MLMKQRSRSALWKDRPKSLRRRLEIELKIAMSVNIM